MLRSVVVAGLLALLVVSGASAAPSFVAVCPDPPGAPAPDEITDDAIETRNQRIADVAICEAYVERLEFLAAQSERQTEVAEDMRWIGGTTIGVVLAAVMGTVLFRTVSQGYLR